MKLPKIAGRSTRLAGALAAILAVSGCVVQDTPDKVAQIEETRDPFEPTNRYIFELNLFLDEMFIKPVAWWYRIGVPDPARERIHLALANLRLPWTAVNDVFQGEMKRAYVASARFVINTTVGVVGLFDAATDWGFPQHEEDAGQTFAVWGAPGDPLSHAAGARSVEPARCGRHRRRLLCRSGQSRLGNASASRAAS